MLSIGKLGVGQADYYLEAVGQGVEDYYTGAGEALGRWLGQAAQELTLRGEVDADALRAVLDGSRPDGGGPLTYSGQGKSRVPGFDLTFSAPKSVSLLFGLGDPEVSRAVCDAHEAAVEASLSYMQRHAGLARRGTGGVVQVKGNGFIGAAFRHRMSRAGDPQLHTHVLVANMTRGGDGRWTALDARHLYAHARTGGFLYQAQLRLELTRTLGVEWTAVRNGVAEVDGVPAATRRAFSRRRAEIEAELSRRGERSREAAQIAALHTRRSKDYAVRADGLRGEWRERARQLDFEPATIGELLDRTGAEPLTPQRIAEGQAHLASADGLTGQSSSFSRRDAIRAWCEQLGQGGDVVQIESAADGLLSSDALVPLLPPADRTDEQRATRSDGERRYTTPEILALEADILQAAAGGRGEHHGRVDATVVRSTVASRPELSAEQRGLVERLLTDGDRVAVVIGKAGTGKTYALDAARQGWAAGGYEVIGAALARRAAIELADGAGIESTTIHALLAELRARPGELLLSRTVLVVDEAGMVGTRHLAELVSHAERAHAKLVLVGDPGQLPEIDAGGSFRALTLRGDPIRLSENRRQSHEYERQALELLRAGRASEALTAYGAHGRLVVTDTAADQRAQIVRDWWDAREQGRDAMLIALRRDDVADLNARARALMSAAGRLGDDVVAVHGQPVAVGDHVVCLRNHSGLGVANGTQGVVTSLDPAAASLTIDAAGREITLPAGYLEDTTRRGGPTLDYAYALTGHKAQGITVDETFVLGSDALYREWGYVAMSRGRHANRLYLVASEPELDDPLRRDDGRRPLDRVAQALARSAAQTSATDAVSVSEMPTPELEQRITELDRFERTAQRIQRRDEALAARDTRLRGEPSPAATPPRDDPDRARERALIVDELDRRQRPARIALLLDAPAYITDRLGPVPDELLARRRWHTHAQIVEDVRERLGHTDHTRALPAQVRDPELRAQAARVPRAPHERDVASREQDIGRDLA